MKLVSPDLASLYTVPEEGDYRVMAYSVERRWARMPAGSFPLSAEQYETFEEGQRLLHGLLAVEEAYDVVMGNYLDLEEVVLRLSANEMAQRRPHGKNDHFDTARRSCHRALANLLSATKAFQDQSQRLVSSISEETSAGDLEQLRASFSRAYDGSLGFRFMSALRNHAQHHGLSVSGVSLTRAAAEPGGVPDQFVTTTPYLFMAELRDNKNFKKSVLNEIEVVAAAGPGPDDRVVPVIPLVRQYLAGLSAVMADVRQLYRDREAKALNFIYAAFYGYTGFYTASAPVGLTVSGSISDDGRVVQFSTDDHFRALALREVNGDLSLLPGTGVRQ